MIGKTFGNYEVLDLLGRGGMGEVYRARDTSLGREVALKLLPTELLSDPERVARFRREARTLAALNHAHIAGLHGVEEHDGHRFLVMELAEGEDLSARIERGPLPLDDALDIARQIADGLEEAHEQGIVHRDLKPANIKVSSEGRVKILDFGLARAFLGETVDESDLGHSPTITAAMTQAGVILGTAAYMSPEQAKGRTVDRRADVWSFGVILWEMLTGNRLFQAETTSEVLAAVLRADPPWEELPESVPVGVRRLLERCLERDPRRRLRDIGEARVRLERWQADPDSLHESAIGLEPATAARSGRAGWLPWALVAVASLVALWGWLGSGSAPVEDASPLRLSILVPGHEQLPQASGGGPALKLSGDGTRLAYNSGNILWLRRLDSMDVQRVEGSDGVRNFTFSPDGRWVAYVAGGKLYRASVTGGAPIEICDAPDPRGIAWVNDTTIVFPPTYLDGIHRVSLETGEVSPVTEVDTGRGERSHRWPTPLPGGREILITCQFLGRDYDESDIQIVSLDTGERRTVYRGGSFGVYTTSGHLLFVRDTTVFAVELDLDSGETRGLPVPVISGIESSVGDQESDNGSAQFAVSASGLFVYRTLASASRQTRLAAFDFETETVSPFGGDGLHARPALSPDGRWLAVGRGAGDDRKLFIFDTATRLERRFTRRGGRNQLGCWSPDSRALYWTSTSGGDGLWWILHQPIDGSTPVDSVASSSDTLLPTSISPDGRWLYLTHWTGANGWDVVRVDLQDSEPSLQTVLGGARNEQQALVSPDGNWMTYFSDESGNFQLYLRRVPDTGAVWQLTRENNVWYGSAWTDEGTGLWVRSDLGFHRIDVDLSGGSVQISPLRLFAEENFQRNDTLSSLAPYADGTGAYVLVGTEGAEEAESQVILITDWFPQLSALVSASR